MSELTPEQEQDIRTLDLLVMMSDRAAATVSGHLAALLAELDRTRAERDAFADRVAELEARPSRAEVLREAACELSDAERQFFGFTLDTVQEVMWSGEGFTDEDEASLAKLRQMAEGGEAS